MVEILPINVYAINESINQLKTFIEAVSISTQNNYFLCMFSNNTELSLSQAIMDIGVVYSVLSQ